MPSMKANSWVNSRPSTVFALSSAFKTLDLARQTTDAMGRSHRAIAHWQLDASGSFEIVEAS
jgi:hypothetical protein